VRTSNYSDYLTDITALMGIELADIQTPELVILNSRFNRALRKIWEASNWVDICPNGEVRFPQNLLTYPNDLSQSANWTASGITVTANAVNNPLDNRQSASKLLETAAPAAHSVSQTAQFYPTQPYQVTGWAAPVGGRQWLSVAVNDGASSYTGFWNVLTGAIGSSTGSSATISIQQQANGFYKWALTFTSSSSASTGTITIGPSPDGVNTFYTGSATAGLNSWGNTIYLQNNLLPAAYYIPWAQTGETPIDAVFTVTANDPGGSMTPYRTNYNLTPNGIELIGPTSTGPVYLYYRQQRPIFTGPNYSSSATYTAGTTTNPTTIYYTSTLGTLAGNYYNVIINTSAGQNPDANAANFSVLQIPYVFEQYCVFNAFADWLIVEGQGAKAQAMYDYAQTVFDDQADIQERQLGQIMPWRVYTHVTSQNRGLGYVGQNNALTGTAIFN